MGIIQTVSALKIFHSSQAKAMNVLFVVISTLVDCIMCIGHNECSKYGSKSIRSSKMADTNCMSISFRSSLIRVLKTMLFNAFPYLVVTKGGGIMSDIKLKVFGGLVFPHINFQMSAIS